jgi:actin related protein 2/3 complex subunit 1A/1B
MMRSYLPLNVVTFISERAVVAGGHDMNPLVFTADGSGNWSFLQLLDQKTEAAKTNAPTSGVQAARALFQNKTSRGQESKAEGDELWTKHENAITCIQRMGRSTDPTCTRFSTSALDGRVVVWDLPTLQIDMRALSL